MKNTEHYFLFSKAIFILDAHFEVYLWLGWFPDDEETETNQSQRRRWDIDKRKAMESTLLYCEGISYF